MEKNGYKLLEIHQPLTPKEGEKESVLITDFVKSFVDISETQWPLLMPYFEQPKGMVIAIKQPKNNG